MKKEKSSSMKNVLKKLYKILNKRQKISFGIIVAIMIISAGLTQITPKAIGWLTDDILTQSEIAFKKVIPFLILILVVNVVNEIIKIVRRVMVEDTATRTEKQARGMVIKSLLMAPLSYFRENMTGNIHGRMNRCLEGTVKLEKLLFMDFAPAIFNSIAAIITIFITLPFVLALPMMLVIPIGIFIVFKQISSQKGIRVELLESKSQMDGTIVELINGIEVIRISDSIDFESNRFNEKSEFLRKKEMKHHKAMAIYDCLKFVNEAVFTVLIIGISTYLAAQNIISVGSVLTAYLCFNQLIKPLEELHRIFDELSECTVLATDFFKMIEIENDFSYRELAEKNEVIEIDPIIKIENLKFYYNEDKNKVILDNLNLSVDKGMFLGIAGPSGCGKSSLIKAICKLEKGYGTINLSGGQRQRIAIARIFLRKPKILILDEATSALDNTSEKHIQTEIEKLQKENNTTIISIAHRLTTLKNCDKIIVLNKGNIVESGKYNELIEKNGIFSDMYYGKLK